MTFDESVIINAQPDALFRLSQDYDRRLEWDPFLRSACLVGEATEAGVGVRALCVSRGGWEMETEYVTFNPPRTTAVRMTRGPWFLDSFAGSWRFEEIARGQTQVSFAYSLRARPGWLSWLLTPILSRVFARETRRRLQALKEAVEQRGLSATVEPGPVDVEHPRFMGTETPNPVEWFDNKWWPTYDYENRHGLEAMSEKNQVLFLVGYLIDQLCCGGASMVYFNPSGRYMSQIAAALDKIGADRAAQAVRELNALFPGGAPAADDEVRHSQFEQLPEQASELGEQLERIFDECDLVRGERTLLIQLYDYYTG